MYILGISGLYHDSAAALLDDGVIKAAAQEERFTRKKQDASFPKHAIEYCLQEAGIRLSEVEHVIFYDKPFLKFERLFDTYLTYAPRGFKSFCLSLPLWLKEKLFQKNLIRKQLLAIDKHSNCADRLLFSEHHLSHAASAFYPSPFQEAAILTLDGVGEWATTTLAHGVGREIKLLKEMQFPHSLGLLYSAFTYYLGFKVNSGEYKVMGLAPYGEPKYADSIFNHLIDLKQDGSFRLDLTHFNYCTSDRMTNQRFADLFGSPPRQPEVEALTQKHMDLAASIQVVVEEVMLRLARFARYETDAKHLCLAGGVALNCVANSKVLRHAGFKKVWVQPAAGDAGGALGAAYCAHYLYANKQRHYKDNRDSMQAAYLGPSYIATEVQQYLDEVGACYDIYTRDVLLEKTASALAEGKAIGWFQGRMEFGPRALGNRSIIADPRSPDMQKQLNLKIKFRESFRPFAPSALAEDAEEWFESGCENPYMLFVTDVKKEKCFLDVAKVTGLQQLDLVRSMIPAVTHVDYSARLQTVRHAANPLYYDLIAAFKAKTGCPLLINTSFNVRGEPIVCSPKDAFECFMHTGLDYLVIENCLLEKVRQPANLSVGSNREHLLD